MDRGTVATNLSGAESRVLRNMSGPKAMLVVAGGIAAVALQGCGSGFTSGALNASGDASKTTQAVSAPSSLGYAWNAADHTLRPILGIPGSSRVGSDVVAGTSAIAGAASAVSSVALLVLADNSVDRILLPAITATPLAGIAAPANARIHFSPTGNAAVIFAAGGTVVLCITNLTTAPQSVTLNASTALLDAAVSDQGAVVVLQRQGTGARMAVFAQGGAVQTVASVNTSGAITFLPKRDDALFADASANTLTLIRNVTATPTLALVPTANLLKTPIALAASQDGRWAAIANGADASVTRIDLSGATPQQRIVCPVQPSTVEQLAGNATFRFSAIGSSPAWVSDLSATTPTMLFVPAISGT